MSCAEADKRYWDRVVFLNAHTDVKLLTHLEVNRFVTFALLFLVEVEKLLKMICFWGEKKG